MTSSVANLNPCPFDRGRLKSRPLFSLSASQISHPVVSLLGRTFEREMDHDVLGKNSRLLNQAAKLIQSSQLVRPIHLTERSNPQARGRATYGCAPPARDLVSARRF